MKYRLDIAPSVVEEARRIYLSREVGSKGSGGRFVDELVDCYARIKAYPFGCQIRKDKYRHIMLRRLKCRVVYKVEGELVSVVQLRHTSRRPSKKFGP